MSSAINTPIVELKIAIADCYSAANPPPTEAVAVAGVFEWDAGAPLTAALASGDLTIITGSDSTARTISTTAVETPTDGKIIRVANGADPNGGEVISIQDTAGSPQLVAIIAAGEVIRLQWFADTANSGTNARWLKIPGV